MKLAFEQHRRFSLGEDGLSDTSEHVEDLDGGDGEEVPERRNRARLPSSQTSSRVVTEDPSISPLLGNAVLSSPSLASSSSISVSSHIPPLPSTSRHVPKSHPYDHRALIRDVISELLPALLRQQQVLMGSAFNAMTSATDAREDNGGAMQFGCRNCETLQRQLAEVRARREALTAELYALQAGAQIPCSSASSHDADLASTATSSQLPSALPVGPPTTASATHRLQAPSIDASE